MIKVSSLLISNHFFLRIEFWRLNYMPEIMNMK